ncbi:MAG TPA: hypothetical protein VN372_10615 [Methanospirillum sp.]|nr:hypothetical protein [Methanospirillum sp.]
MHHSFRSILIIQNILFLLSAIILVPGVTATAPQDHDGTILYTTNFSDATGWTSNSNDRYFHENATGRYHYLIEGGTGSYASVPLPSRVSGPFSLEFDVTPINTDEGATFRFGIGKDSKDSQKGPLVMAEMANKKSGRLFYLTTVSKENALNTIGSIPGNVYPGPTVRYEDGTSYHIRLTYYDTDKRASITINEVGSSDVIFSTFTQVAGRMEDLTTLFLTALGDGVPGPKAEGYIDNIILTLPESQAAVNPTVTVTQEIIEVIPTLAGSSLENITPPSIALPDKVPSRTLIPPPPTSTPTPKSGSLPILTIPAIFCALMILGRQR